MKPEGGGAVEIEIDVMDEMESPEEGDAVRSEVPDPERVVEEHDGDDDPRHTGQSGDVQQPDATGHDPSGKRSEQRSADEGRQRQGHPSGGEIARDAAQLRLDRGA